MSIQAVDTPVTSEQVKEAGGYIPVGAAHELIHTFDEEVVLSGPAGTGKSRACLEYLYLIANVFPGCRLLIVRQTRESLTESALVTFESHVVPKGHPILGGAARKNRSSYAFPNGSEIVVGGMKASGRDMRQKIMSTEYDVIYVQEAIELSEDDWEKLTTRLRNNKIPHIQRLIADTNPDRPTHWLKLRCNAGKTRMLESRHEDNPVLYDRTNGIWTEFGKRYIAKLDNLTGARKARLRKGIWAQSEGMVFEGWDPAIHVVEPRKLDPTWPSYWSIDFGFVNPFVWLNIVVSPDRHVHMVDEIYHSQLLVEDAAKMIKERTQGKPRPFAIICDHDAEDRATIERHLGVKVTPATKGDNAGIQELSELLKKSGDGKTRFSMFRDVRRPLDRDLEEAKRPTSTEQEFDGYVWDKNNSKGPKDRPIKKDDHGMDALRYFCKYLIEASTSNWSDISPSSSPPPTYRHEYSIRERDF